MIAITKMKKNSTNIMFISIGILENIAFKMTLKSLDLAIVFNGLKTLNDLKESKELFSPSPAPDKVDYIIYAIADVTMIQSITFQGFFRYAFLLNKKPSPKIFKIISTR